MNEYINKLVGKAVKKHVLEKRQPLQQMVLGKLDLDLYLSACTKIRLQLLRK
jgi:hypothetical protein